MPNKKSAQMKGIIFDLGGVVVSNDIIKYVESNAAKYYGISRRPIAELRRHEKGRHRLGWDEKKYWMGFAKSIKSDKPPRLFWTEKYGAVTKPKKDVVDIIKRLKKRYKLAVLSNTCEPHIRSNRTKGIFRLFDAEVFSCDPHVDVEKPGAKIYRICLKALKLKGKECVFIDDYAENLAPARKLGMRTIHFKNARQLKSDLAKLGVAVK
ncbi:MAG: HAD family phosphatase [Candidatus Aenigmarchaeota archaeon]|nr:HAD family phosphatase [Candidatus Aenigmarchaeota archaeon]